MIDCLNDVFFSPHNPLQDHDFFQHLEMHMRSEFPPMCGRDHLSFRSYYFPVKVGFPVAFLRPAFRLKFESTIRLIFLLVCSPECDRRRSVRAVQQHGPPQAEKRGRRVGPNAARGLQETGGHPHPLRLLNTCFFQTRTVGTRLTVHIC